MTLEVSHKWPHIKIGLPCLLNHMCFLYIFWSNFAIISDIVPSHSMCMLSLMPECKNAPGMSDTTTYLFSLVSIDYNNIIASIDTVGKLVSSSSVYNLRGLLSAHPHDFVVQSVFYFRNTKYCKAFVICCMTFPFYSLA